MRTMNQTRWLLLTALLGAGCATGRPIPTRTFPLDFAPTGLGLATLWIEDPGGKTCRTLFTDAAQATSSPARDWDGLDDKGRPLPPGVYHARLKVSRWRLDPDGSFGGIGSAPGRFLSPGALSAHPQGARLILAVADTGNQRIQLLTDTGAVMQVMGEFGIGEGRLNQPTDVAWDGQFITVCDSQNRRLARLDARGSFLGEVRKLTGLFNTPSYAGAVDLDMPTRMAERSDGTLVVADRGGRLIRMTSTGGALDVLEMPELTGGSSGLLTWPDGRVWVVLDQGSVLVAGLDGRQGGFDVKGSIRVAGAALGPGFAVLNDAGKGVLRFLDSRGSVFADVAPGGARNPGALCIWEDRLFIADGALNRILKYRLVREDLERHLEVRLPPSGPGAP